MENKRAYVAGLADLTAQLEQVDWDDPDRFFKPTLQAMAKDSARWINNEWLAPNGSTTPVERAIVVLTQDLIVLLGHAANAGLQDDRLAALAQLAIDAAESDVIEDSSHRDFFTHPESPLHGILAGEH